MIAYIYPGQGSQYEGMGEDICQEFKKMMDIYKDCSRILGCSVERLWMKEEGALRETKSVQVGLFLLSFGITKLLEEEGLLCDVCAGHSLGEMTAYVSSGVLSYGDGLGLVLKRGEEMGIACRGKRGGMVGVLGLEDGVVEGICEEERGGGVLGVANYNCRGQVVVSGEWDRTEVVMERLKEGKGKGIRLNVEGGFHSELMRSAAEGFGEFVEGVRIGELGVPVIGNVEGKEVECGKVRELMVLQMTSPVLWRQSIERMLEMGVRTFIEVGAGKVLQGLVGRIAKDGGKDMGKEVKVMGVGKVEDFKGIFGKMLS